MIIIQTNSICIEEKKYIFDQLFNTFLGIAFEHQVNEEIDSIRLNLENNKVIEINSEFFESFNDLEWLSKKSLPKIPLKKLVNVKLDFFEDKPSSKESIPIIFGSDKTYASKDKIFLGIDIFGSCFFMLTRYEEMVVKAKDIHGRFPAKASLAFQEGFLERPIVDEYVEILWRAIYFFCPHIIRKPFNQKTFVSCDVDFITDKGVRFPGIFKRLGGDLLIRKSLKSFFKSINLFFEISLTGKKELDPFNTFDFMMNVCDDHNLKMAFYFIPRNNKKPIDGDYDIQSSEAIDLMKRIIERKHEVGYHASYYSYNDEKETEKEVKLLKKTYKEAGGNPEDIKGGRQHFLRWETGTTENNWEYSGMEYDTTLGYAEHIGFRCGTSKEYNFYNLLERKPLKLKIRPLIVMEVSLLNKNYMNLNFSESLYRINKIKEKINEVNGNFTLLWHNSTFSDKKYKELFKESIKTNY